jgi:hypothetical protein
LQNQEIAVKGKVSGVSQFQGFKVSGNYKMLVMVSEANHLLFSWMPKKAGPSLRSG